MLRRRSACGSTALDASVNTRTGTPFSGTSTVKASANIGTGLNSSSKDCLELVQVSGSGSAGAVTVSARMVGARGAIETAKELQSRAIDDLDAARAAEGRFRSQ